MKILAFDSSSSVASVAVVDIAEASAKEVTLYQYHEAHERTNSAPFFHGLQNAIRQAGRPDRLVVGLGPGSYNGLRSSIAAAQGIASAIGIDLVGISSALAFEEGRKGCWVMGDARGGQYWLALVVEHHFLREPFLLSLAEVPDCLATYPDLPLIASTSLELFATLHNNIIIKSPDAVLLASLGKARPPSTCLEPLYLKPAHITSPRSS